jgi:hypothetical protein
MDRRFGEAAKGIQPEHLKNLETDHSRLAKAASSGAPHRFCYSAINW